MLLPLEELPEELPGDSAPPVAEPAPERPKYENTLWRQLGWERSVLASKLGADCSLEVSPENTNVYCWPLVPVLLEAVLLEELEAPMLGRRSIQGTATCLPELLAVELLELPDKDELELPALLRLLEALPELVPEGLVLLPELEGLVPELLPEGLVAPPELPALPDNDKTAKSILPEAGLTMMSLMVPTSLPELLVTCAPVSWLPLIS